MSHQMTQQHDQVFFLNSLFFARQVFMPVLSLFVKQFLSRWEILLSLPTRTLFPDLMINCAFCKNHHIPEKAYSKCHIWLQEPLYNVQARHILQKQISGLHQISMVYPQFVFRGNHVNPVFTWCALKIIEIAEYSMSSSIINHCNLSFLTFVHTLHGFSKVLEVNYSIRFWFWLIN